MEKIWYYMIVGLQRILIWLFILRSTNKSYTGGLKHTQGIIWWNPLSYLFILIGSVVIGVVAFFRGVGETWRDAFHPNDKLSEL